VKFKHVAGMTMTVNAERLSQLRKARSIDGVFEDRMRKSMLIESVPVIGATKAWSMGADGQGQVVAVIDTGVDGRHEFLRGKLVNEACFSSQGVLFGDSLTSLCSNGQTAQFGSGAAAPCVTGCDHGTHVAGIVAGQNGKVSGVAPGAKILAVQAFTLIDGPSCENCLSAFDSDIIQALEWVYEQRHNHQIAAVNLSLGSDRFRQSCDASTPITQIIDLLKEAGIATIVASGNEFYKDSIASPACISSAISVGATDIKDNVAGFSNSANILDLLAPGLDYAPAKEGGGIYSSIPGAGFVRMPGTSAAAPHVAGAFAVLRSKVPDVTVDQMLAVLKKTGEFVTDSNNALDKPRVRLDKAVAFLTKQAKENDRNEVPEPVEEVTPEPVEKVLPVDEPDAQQAPVVEPDVELDPVVEPDIKPVPKKRVPEFEVYDGIKVYKEGYKPGEKIDW